jgi:hypothetical protein
VLRVKLLDGFPDLARIKLFRSLAISLEELLKLYVINSIPRKLLEVTFADIELENALATDSKGRAFENRIPKPYFSGHVTSSSHRIPLTRICCTVQGQLHQIQRSFILFLFCCQLRYATITIRFGHTNPIKDHLSSSIISAFTTS